MKLFILVVAVLFLGSVAADDYGYGTPTPKPTQKPTRKPTRKPTQNTPPPCPPVKNCHKKPECGACHSIRITKQADGKKQCCPEYKCVPKKCTSPPKCSNGKRRIIKKTASAKAKRCCPVYACISKCHKKQCKCGHEAKCADGKAPKLVKKANKNKGICCPVYKCKTCCRKPCKAPKCGAEEIPRMVSPGRAPNKPCCPKYKCVKRCKCPKVKACPPGWKKVKDSAKGAQCKCNWYKCQPPPCYKKKCEKPPKKCGRGQYLKMTQTPGKNGQKPCCCRAKCVKKECSKIVCKTLRCGKYSKLVTKEPAKGECCPTHKCVPLCPKVRVAAIKCKKHQIRVVVKAAHEDGPAKPCQPKYRCKNKCCKSGCPKKPTCPKDWILKSKKDRRPYDCCKHYTCKPKKCGKCLSTRCKSGDTLQIVGTSADGCCPKKVCKPRCSTVKCPSKPSCPKGWLMTAKSNNKMCCPVYSCKHPCSGKACKRVKCRRHTYPVVTRDSGYDGKSKKFNCCPKIVCKPVCGRRPECSKPKCPSGWDVTVIRKASPKRGVCCATYQCRSPCYKKKCSCHSRAIKKCTSSGGRPVFKYSSFPKRPCCAKFSCKKPCPKTPYCKPLVCPKGYKSKPIEVSPAGNNGNLPCCPKQRCIPQCRGVKCKKPKCRRGSTVTIVKGSDGPKGPRCCPTYKCQHRCKKQNCPDVSCPAGWKKERITKTNYAKGICCCKKKCVPPCNNKQKCKVPKCKYGRPIMVASSNYPLTPCCAEYRCPTKCEKGGCCVTSQPKNCPKLGSCKPWQKAQISPSKNGCCPKLRCIGPCARSRKPLKKRCGKGQIRVLVKHGLRPKAKPCHNVYKCVSKCSLDKCEKCKAECKKGYTLVTVAKRNPKKGVCCDVVRCKPKCASEKCKTKCPSGESPVFLRGAKSSLTSCPKYGCCPKYKCVSNKCRNVRCKVPRCPAGKYPVEQKKKTKDGCCSLFKCVASEEYGAEAGRRNCPGYECPGNFVPKMTKAFLWDKVNFCPQWECVRRNSEDEYLTRQILNQYAKYE